MSQTERVCLWAPVSGLQGADLSIPAGHDSMDEAGEKAAGSRG